MAVEMPCPRQSNRFFCDLTHNELENATRDLPPISPPTSEKREEKKKRTSDPLRLQRVADASTAIQWWRQLRRDRRYRRRLRVSPADDAAQQIRGCGVGLVLLGQGREHFSWQLGPEGLVKATEVSVPSAHEILELSFSLHSEEEFLQRF